MSIKIMIAGFLVICNSISFSLIAMEEQSDVSDSDNPKIITSDDRIVPVRASKKRLRDERGFRNNIAEETSRKKRNTEYEDHGVNDGAAKKSEIEKKDSPLEVQAKIIRVQERKIDKLTRNIRALIEENSNLTQENLDLNKRLIELDTNNFNLKTELEHRQVECKARERRLSELGNHNRTPYATSESLQDVIPPIVEMLSPRDPGFNQPWQSPASYYAGPWPHQYYQHRN